MNSKKTALCLASVASHLDNFCRNDVKILQSLGYDVTLASNFFTDESNNSQEKINAFINEMEADGVHIAQIDFSRRVGHIRAQVKSYRQLKGLLKQKFDLIHCHTPICAAMTRIAAKKWRKKGSKVIYTAHGFHFYDGAPIKNWLIFYPIEWLCSWWTDVLITINKEDYKRASEHFHAKKTVYIPGVGIDTEKFKPRESGREKIRKELGLKDTDIMFLSVGELNENKNHEAVIKALAGDSAVDSKSFKDVVYVIVGKGELEEHLKAVSEELSNNVNINATDIADIRIVGYRNDVADFYDAADIYILPSIREGLNVSLMEAMASGLSIVCSNIRGNTDLIEDKSCLFDPMNIMDIKRAIDYAIQNKSTLATKNLAKIRTFDLSSVQSLVSDVYSDNNHNIHNIIIPPPNRNSNRSYNHKNYKPATW